MRKVEEGTRWTLSGWTGTVALPTQTLKLGLLGVAFVIPSLMQGQHQRLQGGKSTNPWALGGSWLLKTFGGDNLQDRRESCLWYWTPGIPALGKLKQEAVDEFRDNLGCEALLQNQTATGKTSKLAKCLLHNHDKDLHSIPRTHIEKPGVVIYAFNPSTGEFLILGTHCPIKQA